jgi:hypothetical protein
MKKKAVVKKKVKKAVKGKAKKAVGKIAALKKGMC